MSTLIANRVEHASPLCDRLVPLRDACLDAWNATRSELPRLGPGVTRWQQWRNARATGQLIDEIALRVDEHPEQTTEQRVWRDRLRVTLQDFGERRFGWPNGYRRLLFGDAFYESSVAFVRQARAFDSSSKLDDLWQAMRNVWIGNNLQMLLGVPVCLTQGLFAYSMLYPVTDNVLDALDRSSDDKRAFNDRFGQRLCGHHVMARDRSEASACALVSQIEEEFPRGRYADVWDSILAIHRGQVDSLRQQGGDWRNPCCVRSASRKAARQSLPTCTSSRVTPPSTRSASRSAMASSFSCSTTCRTSPPIVSTDTTRSSRSQQRPEPSTI